MNPVLGENIQNTVWHSYLDEDHTMKCCMTPCNVSACHQLGYLNKLASLNYYWAEMGSNNCVKCITCEFLNEPLVIYT